MDCLIITIASLIFSLAISAMSFNYSFELKKGHAKLKKELSEVERVNGKEKRAIAELQSKILFLQIKDNELRQQVQELKEKLSQKN